MLEDQLTISGQGLVYNFDNEQYGGKAAAKVQADAKDAEADGIDVYLALINGVVGRNKELKYDNGALQVRMHAGGRRRKQADCTLAAAMHDCKLAGHCVVCVYN